MEHPPERLTELEDCPPAHGPQPSLPVKTRPEGDVRLHGEPTLTRLPYAGEGALVSFAFRLRISDGCTPAAERYGSTPPHIVWMWSRVPIIHSGGQRSSWRMDSSRSGGAAASHST